MTETAVMPGGGVLVRPVDVDEDAWSLMVATARADRMQALQTVRDRLHVRAWRDHMQACFDAPLSTPPVR